MIGRRTQRAWLEDAVAEAVAGRGALVLLAGDAGVGKTRLAEDVLRRRPARLPARRRDRRRRSPTGRSSPPCARYLRARRTASRRCGPLRPHLALLLPELGEARPQRRPGDAPRGHPLRPRHDRRASARPRPARRPPGVRRGDAGAARVACAHAARAAAADRRRLPLGRGPARSTRCAACATTCAATALLRELTLEPLGAGGDRPTLAERVLGKRRRPRLAAACTTAPAACPFFVEELASALLPPRDACAAGPAGLELALRRRRAAPADDPRRRAAASAPTSPTRPARPPRPRPSPARVRPRARGGARRRGRPRRAARGRAARRARRRPRAFRHPLAREALYDDIPWLRRRALHRRARRAARGAGREPRRGRRALARAHASAERALEALVEAVGELAAVHAYRDAARARPPGAGALARGRAHRRAARPARALRARSPSWRATRPTRRGRSGRSSPRADRRRRPGAGRRRAPARRDLRAAGRPRARAGRAPASPPRPSPPTACPGEAAAERLVARRLPAVRRPATPRRARAGRAWRARRRRAPSAPTCAHGPSGSRAWPRPRRGEFEAGIEIDPRGPVARAGARADRRGGRGLPAARHRPRARAATTQRRARRWRRPSASAGPTARHALEHTCLELHGLRAARARRLGPRRGALPRPDRARRRRRTTRWSPTAFSASILAFRGEHAAARPLLERCLQTAAAARRRLDGATARPRSRWLAAEEGDAERAAEHCRFLLERWSRTRGSPLRRLGPALGGGLLRPAAAPPRGPRLRGRARRAIAAGRASRRAGRARPRARRDRARRGRRRRGRAQLGRAVDLHETLDIPFERAQILLRAGSSPRRAGSASAALEHLAEAHRIARRARRRARSARRRPRRSRRSASRVEQRLGRARRGRHENAGLSRRELEVVRLVAAGRTQPRDRRASSCLSPRTVDMHVRNILGKLGCHSRTAAAARARELGLLEA